MHKYKLKNRTKWGQIQTDVKATEVEDLDYDDIIEALEEGRPVTALSENRQTVFEKEDFSKLCGKDS